METYNQKESVEFTAAFTDFDGVATTPTTVRYKLLVRRPEHIITDWTSVTPGTSVVITLTSDEMDLVDDTLQEETHVLLIETTSPGGVDKTEEIPFNVRRVQGVA